MSSKFGSSGLANPHGMLDILPHVTAKSVTPVSCNTLALVMPMVSFKLRQVTLEYSMGMPRSSPDLSSSLGPRVLPALVHSQHPKVREIWLLSQMISLGGNQIKPNPLGFIPNNPITSFLQKRQGGHWELVTNPEKEDIKDMFMILSWTWESSCMEVRERKCQTELPLHHASCATPPSPATP